MKNCVGAIALYFILLFSLGCGSDSDKREMYNLQQRCGQRAEQWAKSRPGDILHYRVHYNEGLNKCFVLASVSPVISNNVYSSFDILVDVDENKQCGHYLSRFLNDGSESHQCNIMGEHYGGSTRAQAEQKWKAFVKEMMDK